MHWTFFLINGVKEEQESERFMKFPELEETKFIITALKASPEIYSPEIYIKNQEDS